MLMVAVWSKRRDQSVLKPALDHLISVGRRFADADINFQSVAIDGHVTVAGSVMFCPALDEMAIDGENICLIGEVHARVRAQYVFSQRRDSAMVVLARNLVQIQIGKLLTA